MTENQRTTRKQKVISIYQDLLYPLIVNFDKFCQHRSVCDADEKYNIISSWGGRGGGEYRLHSKKCKKSNLELTVLDLMMKKKLVEKEEHLWKKILKIYSCSLKIKNNSQMKFYGSYLLTVNYHPYNRLINNY